MTIYLIRHGKTKGNLEKRYIGRTDEPLCKEGIEELKIREYPTVNHIFASPMTRCIETAHLIYPGKDIQVVYDLREMDFGVFEGKNYKELSETPTLKDTYQMWVDSFCESPIPEGESKALFSKRCVEAFEKCLQETMDLSEDEAVAFVVHGGTIMSIMEQYGTPKGEYYRWNIGNGEYLTLNL